MPPVERHRHHHSVEYPYPQRAALHVVRAATAIQPANGAGEPVSKPCVGTLATRHQASCAESAT